MPVTIHQATLKECKVCYELSGVPELATPFHEPPPLFWFQNIVKEKQILLVAKDNKKIIGFRMGERIAGNWAAAHLMVVHPAYRNKGVGTQLIEAFETECKKRNMHGIMTYVHNNPATLAFFKKKGYILGSTVIEAVKPLDEYGAIT